MNKKGGFTLIELLAVIVILAIIAVIAVPIVLNIIDETKNNATLRSAEMYVKAAELSIANSTLKDKNITDGTYNLKDGDICLNTDCTDKIEVEVNGEVPEIGKITITNGNISSIELNYKEGKTIVKNSDGDLVYQEITEPIKLCTANTTKAKALVYNSGDPGDQNSYNDNVEVGLLASDGDAYAKGVSYTCDFGDTDDSKNLTFFVLSSTADTVTLISGANLVGTVAWSSDGNNHKDETEDKQAVTAKAALTERTSNWSIANGGKLSEEQMSTIKLPTAYQIAEAVGQTFSGEISEIINGLPAWLNSYTETPVAYGYWTSTPYAEYSEDAWYVYYDGSITISIVDIVSYYGVRPVITISKSNV